MLYLAHVHRNATNRCRLLLVLPCLLTVLFASPGQAESNPRVVLCRGSGECGDTSLSRTLPQAELEQLVGEPGSHLGSDPYVLCVGPRCKWTTVPPGDIELTLGGDGEAPYIADSADPSQEMRFTEGETESEGMTFSEEEAGESMTFSEEEADGGMTFSEEEVEDAIQKLCRNDSSLCNFAELENAFLLLGDFAGGVDVVPSGTWQIHNQAAVMRCDKMTIPIKASTDKGRFESSQGGKRVRAVGLSEDSQLDLIRKGPGAYAGQVQVVQDQVPVVLNFVLTMKSETTFKGSLASIAAHPLMSCRMIRHFSGKRLSSK